MARRGPDEDGSAATDARSARDAPPAAPRVLFLGRTYAGHRTRFLNLRAHAERDARIEARFREVTGWRQDGLIERAPFLPRGAKGRLRAALEAAPFAMSPRPDLVWTSAGDVIVPYLWTQTGRRRPVVLDLDWTLEQQERLARWYFHRPPKTGPRAAVARAQERALWRSVTVFLPWSTWAAASLRRQGVAAERIRVIPPGVDLNRWQPRRAGQAQAQAQAQAGPLRLLFVGGDFERKGGDLLLDAVRGPLAGRCEVDIVTRDPVPASPGVRVHRAEPNSPALRALYAEADLFVMPTRAECFGIATVEALASGLPAVVGDVGGARDIIEQGVTGWLIPPAADALTGALERALAHRESLPAMGARGRRVAEERFDERRNAARVIDALLDAATIFNEEQQRRRRRPLTRRAAL